MAAAAILLASTGVAAVAGAPVQPGIAAVAAQATTQTRGSIVVGGRTRTYQLLRRTSLPAGVHVPLVVVLHGAFGTGALAITQGNWQRAVATRGVIVVAPDGIGRTWNAGACCGPAQWLGTDDVGFIIALVRSVEARQPVDPRRVYATGISNGGMMAYRLGCEASTVFAGIAPVAANLLVACRPARSVSVLHIHGLADENVPFGGGIGAASFQLQSPDYPPVMNALARWATIDRCSNRSAVTGGKLATTTWSGCASGTGVRLLTISDGGHSWPGGQRMSIIADPPSTALDATSTMLDFFAAHPRPG